jgi:hypothetical protein
LGNGTSSGAKNSKPTPEAMAVSQNVGLSTLVCPVVSVLLLRAVANAQPASSPRARSLVRAWAQATWETAADALRMPAP